MADRDVKQTSELGCQHGLVHQDGANNAARGNNYLALDEMYVPILVSKKDSNLCVDDTVQATTEQNLSDFPITQIEDMDTYKANIGKDENMQIILRNSTDLDDDTKGNSPTEPNKEKLANSDINNCRLMSNKDILPMKDNGNADDFKKGNSPGILNTEVQSLKDLTNHSNETHGFQMHNGISDDPLDDLDVDTVCGIGTFRPQWLQSWATARVYLVLYSIIGTLSGAYYAYRVGTITTMEKRFAFESKISGTIMMVDEVTPVFFGALVGYYGGKTHRPRTFFLGMMFIVAACLVSALPYFMYGSEKHLSNLGSLKNESKIQMCEVDGWHEEDCNADSRPPSMTAISIFVFASFLKGFGNLGYHSVGLSYLDDAAKKKNTPLYLAAAFTSRLLGPFLGFLLSSQVLKYYENPLENPGYSPEDPRWIGAWWLGYCFNAVLLFICSVPLLIFPRRLPGHLKIEDTTNKSDIENKLVSNISGLFFALKRLAKNPLYAAVTLHAILTIYAGIGYGIMLPKYMEHQFRLSASDASLYSGPPAVAAIMVSGVVGSYFVWKYKPNPKRIILGMITLEVLGIIGYGIMLIPRCDPIEMTHFGINKEGFMLDGSCNLNCNCSTNAFTPVCGPDGKTVYFSPCFAGCTEKMNETYTDCLCIPDSIDQENMIAKSGFCSSDTCWTQALIYLTILPIVEFFLNLLRVPQSMLILRCIAPKDKSVALGTFEALICILGFVPYMVAFGAVVDTTCLVWEKSCGDTGNCWFYDIQSLSYLLHGASMLFSFIAAFALIIVYFLSDKLRDFYEDEAAELCSVVETEINDDIVKRNTGIETKF